jgi:glycine betaine/proline transport system ATP-binding protein
LQRPSAGDVWLDDANLAAMPEARLMDIRRHRMGMVFQNFGLVPHFTALQNIAFPLKVRGEPAADCAAKANEMLSLVGLDGRGDAYPSELSGGQQQRVGIARSLAVDPEVWLLDEPFSALDPLIRKQLQDELLELQARLRKTIIFVTHDFSEAVRLADRIAIMRDGRIIQQGRAAELLLTPADDYVSRFVGDVSRLQVLRLSDMMQPATRAKTNGLKLPADITLEDMLVTTGGDVTAITVIDADGRTIGSADRQDIMDKIRQQAPAK